MIYFLPANGLPIAVKARLSRRSRSSFYYKPKKPAKDERLRQVIDPVHKENPFYGPKQIARELKLQGTVVNHKCVSRLMKKYEMHVAGRPRKRQKNQYSGSKTSFPNLIKNMVIDKPNYVWAGDFTELRWKRRTYYLATVMDLYTREIVGWHIATNHSVDLVSEALRMAVGSRVNAPLIFHSDHGSEYVSDIFKAKLKSHGITPSNSGKGKPWQNGFQESFYNPFKKEFGDPNRFHLFPIFFEALSQQFHRYNTRRIHSKLKMPPRMFYELKMREAENQEKPQSLAA